MIDKINEIIDEKEQCQLQALRLEAENKRLKGEIDFLKNNEYREALKEIRDYIERNTDFDKSDLFLSSTPAYDILVILAQYGE